MVIILPILVIITIFAVKVNLFYMRSYSIIDYDFVLHFEVKLDSSYFSKPKVTIVPIKRPNYYRNHHTKSETDRTIELKKIVIRSRRTYGRSILIIAKASVLKI